MNAINPQPCPSDELLSRFLDGRVTADERKQVVAHLSLCARCRNTVADALEIESDLDDNAAFHTPVASAAERDVQPKATPTLWIAAAAALIGVTSLIYFFAIRSRSDHLARLVAAMPDQARTVEPRLTGGFRWAPLSDVRRSGDANNAARLVTIGAAGATLKEIGQPRTRDTQHATAIAHLLAGNRRNAIAILETLTKTQPRDADAWSDLAATLYCDAVERHDPVTLQRALAAADRAIGADATLREGYFNRALILEKMGSDQARGAWNRYLFFDPESPWAVEAREHRNALSPP